MDYEPKVGHVAGFLFFGVILGALGGALAKYPKVSGVLVGSWIACLVIVGVFLITFIWKPVEQFWWTVGTAADKLEKMSSERFEVLGMSLPKIRVRWTGSHAVQYYDDTDVPLVYFQRFMKGADKTQIFPERNCREDWLPVWAWGQIKQNLEVRGWVIEESAAGNKSWRWRNDTAYEKCRKHFEEFLYDEIPELE